MGRMVEISGANCLLSLGENWSFSLFLSPFFPPSLPPTKNKKNILRTYYVPGIVPDMFYW